MGNNFVKYLNSMNNASSDNPNALAESQVLTDYYDRIKVEREIGNYIFDLLFNGENKSLILTGHAGDGKTSILIQVLYRLGYFDDSKKPLKEVETYGDFLYVKDMSELSEEKQQEYLKEVIKAPSNNKSSLLISNTGPIINTFNRIIKDKEEAQNFEMKLLENIDSVISKDIDIKLDEENYKLIIINIANIDNSYFIEDLINKITNEDLWIGCRCEKIDTCPIYNNYLQLKQNKSRVSEFIKRLYIYFAENESRLTIRQMLAHITYAMTGNLECEQIKRMNINIETLFEYSFSNQFFGYSGKYFNKDSYNIKAIQELNKIKLDEKSIKDIDHQLFVKEDFNCFNKSISKILEHMLKNNMESLSIDNEDSILLRRAFRRYYILFSKLENDNLEYLLNELFSNIFTDYYQLISQDYIKPNMRVRIQKIIFEALFKLFLGVYPRVGNDKLYLTLKKDYESEQNVQVLLGELDKDIIKLDSREIKNNIEKSIKRYIPIIRFEDVYFELTYQKFDYLNRIYDGQIFTSLNPNFTFGLTKLKADLLRKYKRNSDDIKLLLVKKGGLEKITFNIENQTLTVIR